MLSSIRSVLVVDIFKCVEVFLVTIFSIASSGSGSQVFHIRGRNCCSHSGNPIYVFRSFSPAFLGYSFYLNARQTSGTRTIWFEWAKYRAHPSAPNQKRAVSTAIKIFITSNSPLSNVGLKNNSENDKANSFHEHKQRYRSLTPIHSTQTNLQCVRQKSFWFRWCELHH